MGAVIVSLLPLIVGAALLPVWIIMALFLLRGKGGLLEGGGLCRRGNDGARGSGRCLWLRLQ